MPPPATGDQSTDTVTCVQIQSVGEPRGRRGIIVAAERRIVRT